VTTGWDATGVTLDQDTVNYAASASATRGSLRATHIADDDAMFIGKSISATDLTNNLVHLRVYIAPDTTLTSIAIYLRSGGSWANFKIIGFDLTYWPAGQRTGWIDLWSAVPLAGSETGTLDTAAVEYIRVSCGGYVQTNTGAITIDALEFYAKPMTTPKHAITFDDGGPHQWSAASYLLAKGLRATWYIVPNRIDTSGYFTLAQLKILQRAGHLIANHSYAHSYFVADALSLPERVAEISDGAVWLRANGFADGAATFAVPGGTSQWSTDDWDNILGVYCDSIRLTFTPSHILSPIQPGYATTQCFDNPTQSIAALAKCVASGANSCHGFHDGTQTTNGNIETYFDAVAAAVAAGTLDCVTVPELWQ
jgi:hypothetical protein